MAGRAPNLDFQPPVLPPRKRRRAPSLLEMIKEEEVVSETSDRAYAQPKRRKTELLQDAANPQSFTSEFCRTLSRTPSGPCRKRPTLGITPIHSRSGSDKSCVGGKKTLARPQVPRPLGRLPHVDGREDSYPTG